MWYAIISEDTGNSLPLRKIHRPDHLARLQQLAEEERLLTAGPLPAIDSDDPGDAGYSGSLVIAQFECLADAQAWAEQDPYLLNNIYKNVTVKPYKNVLP